MLGLNKKSGFTLIELLVVISIIALLLSIIMPALGKAKLLARRIECQSNMRSLVVTQLLYTENNDGKFAKHNGIYPDYVKNADSLEHVREALDQYDIGKLTICKIYATAFGRDDPILSSTTGTNPAHPTYGAWDSGVDNIYTPYYWFANLRRWEADDRYGRPEPIDGEPAWPKDSSDCSSRVAMMTHRINVAIFEGMEIEEFLPKRGHGQAEVNSKLELPVTYGDGHLEVHFYNDIKYRMRMDSPWGTVAFVY